MPEWAEPAGRFRLLSGSFCLMSVQKYHLSLECAVQCAQNSFSDCLYGSFAANPVDFSVRQFTRGNK